MKTNIIALFICLCSLYTFSQNIDRERIKTLKISFITSKLDLTVKEAQAFWPVYNAYDEATLKIKHQDIRNIRREIKQNLNTLNDSRAEKLLEDLVIAENKLHDENLNLIKNLKKIISPKKIILLKVAEEDFNRQLFDQYKKKRLQNRN